MNDLNLYFQAWRFRKRYFFLIALPLILAISIIAKSLPPVYESKSTILIEQQQIPSDFVRSTVSGFADEHIQLLTQQILSRPKLLEIIKQFNLYSEMKKTDTTEEVIEQMRKDIQFKTISAEQTRKPRQSQSPELTIAFRISYQGRNPETVQKVAGTLASLYLEQNLKFREAKAQTTTKFLEAELEGLRERIAELGKKITKFKQTHEGMLPELHQFNLSQADRLENDIKQINNSIRAAENQKIYLEGLLSQVNLGSSPMVAEDESKKMTPQERLLAINNKLSDLRPKYSEDHPDVQKALREKIQTEKLLKKDGGSGFKNRQKLIRLEAELAQKQGTYSDQHPDIQRLRNEIAQIKSKAGTVYPAFTDLDLAIPSQVNLLTQMESSNNEINSLKKQRQNLEVKLNLYRHRLEEGPKFEQEYLALERDYQNAQLKYREVMNKLLEARIGEGMEEHQKGEKFTLIEPASYPEKPIKPNLPFILIAGSILSIMAGLVTMVNMEKQDHSIKSVEELASLTKTPPLGIIARIETPYDQSRKRQRRWLLVIGTCCSLLLGTLLFHFFYMDLGIFFGRLLRFS